MQIRTSNEANANHTPFSAFGGMVAFCVIIGDTIPSVIAALFPSLSDLPFLWLLTNRRAMIMVCTLCFSYPLSLYRDIAKVQRNLPFYVAWPSLTKCQLARASTLALLSMAVIERSFEVRRVFTNARRRLS